MNCEDIAFNLMVANATGKPPIKVYKIIESKVKTFLHICLQGWSKEKVQMFNSQLWECGDALQCCRWPQWPLIRKKCTFVFPHPGHLEERSRCLDFFLKLYGDPSPLRQVAVDCCVEILNDIFQVQFRADPVLYKDNLPAAMKKFNDMGSLWYLAKWMVVMIKKSQTIHFRKIKWPCYR